MQVMIITSKPQTVVDELQSRIRRGITILNDAEGAFSHHEQKVLLTVLTRDQIPMLQHAMEKADPKAFVSISENVTIMGNFYETID